MNFSLAPLHLPPSSMARRSSFEIRLREPLLCLSSAIAQVVLPLAGSPLNIVTRSICWLPPYIPLACRALLSILPFLGGQLPHGHRRPVTIPRQFLPPQLHSMDQSLL